MSRAWHALLAYTALAVLATWPLALGLGRDVAGDFGDPVLNIWIIAWDCEQLLAILGGDFSRIATFFDANVFHPAPLSLAYSEHLIPQALQVLPVYAASRNPILAYNLVFLSTFVLSGLGMYLFVRELTGNARAAFVAGLLFAFAPYRFPQTPHIQVISSQWMPFVLLGFHRFCSRMAAGERGAGRALAGAAGALVLQALSCGYYLLYFSPFAAAYAAWETVRHGLWRSWRVWLRLAAAAAGVLLVVAPFLLPYAAVRGELGFVRPRSEVIRYSADVHSWATAASTLWGDVLRAYPKPEGDLFPGVVPILLGALGVVAALRGVRRDPAERRRWLAVVLGAAVVLHLVAALIAMIYRRVLVDLWLFDLQISDATPMLARAGVLLGVLVVVSSTARTRARQAARQYGFFLLGLGAAMWLALGPVPQSLGRPIDIAAPYGFLYEHVPGFEGVRVPARMAMIAVFMLSVLGGFGAAVLTATRTRQIVLALLSVFLLVEALVFPFPVNAIAPVRGYATPEARLYRPARAPAVYREIARLPPEAAIAELPLGEPDFDLRAMYYSLVHGRPLLNGYSGFQPRNYGTLELALSDVARQTGAALEALDAFGATHVVVHEGAYLDDRGRATTKALLAQGAVEIHRDRSDVLLQLP